MGYGLLCSGRGAPNKRVKRVCVALRIFMGVGKGTGGESWV